VSDEPQLKKYMDLDQKGRIMAEYVWIDSEGGVRSKSRTLDAKDGGYQPGDLPVWNFDGSSTGKSDAMMLRHNPANHRPLLRPSPR
jgi:glutamine synthetase